jgi:hypothetical protein
VNLDMAARLESDIDEAMARGDLDQAEALAQSYRARALEEEDTGAGLSPRFRSRYLAAQVALAGGRLAEAGQRLATLMPLPGDLPVALSCRIWLTSAEVLARERREAEARGCLIRAQAFPSALADNPLLKLREIRVRLWLGQVDELAEEMTACGKALHRRGDLANLTLLACEEGRAWDAADRLDRAAECWTRAEEISRALGGDPARADVLVQLGRLEHLRGNLQLALDRYDLAARSGTRAQQQEAQLRKLLVLLDLNQWGQARTGWARALAGSSAERLPEEVRPVARLVEALLSASFSPVQGTGSGQPQAGGAEADAYQAAMRGDVATARRLYLRALEETRAPARRARLALALGMLSLAARDGPEARRWLDQAEKLAGKEDLPEVAWRALQALGQLAAEVDGDDERARALLERAVLLSEAQARKLTHRADAVTHGLRRGDVLRKLLLAACRRSDAAAVFRYQELERGRLLLELWRSAPAKLSSRPGEDDRLADLDRRIAALEGEVDLAGSQPPEGLLRRREELLLERDRLFDSWLRDRSKASSALPTLPDLEELQRAVRPGSVYLAPALVEDELYLLVCRAGRRAEVVRAPGSAAALSHQVEQLRKCLDGQLERYRRGFPLGPSERTDLDSRLETLGRGCLGDVLWQVLDAGGGAPERVVWVPDGVLHGLPLHALRRGGRYLVETHEVVFTFGGALFVHQGRRPSRRRLFPRALVLAEAPEVLPAAAREGEGVAGTFWSSRLLHGAGASRAALRKHLPGASVVHLACHANFDVRHPLSASISLPSRETWRALEWLDEPLDGLPLVTLSACRSAEVGALIGREVFGLVTGLLGSGVRSVAAGLWPVADREALPFMWTFYRERLTADAPTALARTQRWALEQPGGSPLFWAAFALFGDADALPAPGRCLRWLARWRQKRHARRFPATSQPSPPGA